MSDQLPLMPPQRKPITLDEYIDALLTIQAELRRAGITESPQVQAWSVILKRHHVVLPTISHEYLSPREQLFWKPGDPKDRRGPLVIRVI